MHRRFWSTFFSAVVLPPKVLFRFVVVVVAFSFLTLRLEFSIHCNDCLFVFLLKRKKKTKKPQ